MGNEVPVKTAQGLLAEAWGMFGPSHVPYRILLLSKMIDRLTTKQVRKLTGLTLAEWRVVAHLAAIGKTSAARISKAAMVDRAEISRAVRALSEKGLIARLSDPADQRIAVLGLTDEGRSLFDATQSKRVAFFAELTDELDDEELQQLDSYLFRIAKVADRMLADKAQFD